MTDHLKWVFTICLGLFVGLTYHIARPISAPLADGVYLEELTWVETRDLIQLGKTIAIIPTGGTEQNGPHVVLGKHNYIVRHTAGEIAKALGNALVAPVMSYVPEGPIEPAEGHMRFPGTLSVPEPVFEQVLISAARSLKAHGFQVICFVGDSGGNQNAQQRVAGKLNQEWAEDGVRVLHVGEYYTPDANGQIAWLLEQGETMASIGTHAGIRDTSELMAVYGPGVREALRQPGGGHLFRDTGVIGDPTKASAEIGQKMISLKVEAAVNQINKLLAQPQS